MKRKEKVYEGKAKILYATDDADLLLQYFKDDATAFDATKRGVIASKGVCNNKISACLFEVLAEQGVPTHFVRALDERSMLVRRVEIIPVEVTMRNIVAGGMSRMLGVEEGVALESPVLEYHYKSDALHDPLFNEYHIFALKIATREEMREIDALSFRINDILRDFFGQRNLDLVDFKLEFGRFKGGVILADEISPDTCRLWEKGTGKKMDKDRFRRDLGDVGGAYQEVLRRCLSIV
ncbi:MAG: phosphoribosylaminoimidazolesuccinocarboxamide synthase [Candidatus Omnitrophota bacterium]